MKTSKKYLTWGTNKSKLSILDISEKNYPPTKSNLENQLRFPESGL